MLSEKVTIHLALALSASSTKRPTMPTEPAMSQRPRRSGRSARALFPLITIGLGVLVCLFLVQASEAQDGARGHGHAELCFQWCDPKS